MSYNIISSSNPFYDTLNNKIIINLTVEKSNWIYLETNDLYPNNHLLNITNQNNIKIQDNFIWRENNKIFILDDPTTTYHLIYYNQKFLFDVELSLTNLKTTSNKNITAIINLINVGESGLVNATLRYELLKDNQILLLETENITITGSKTYTKNINTKNLKPGIYSYKVTHYYGNNQSAMAETEFEIEKIEKSNENKKDLTFLYIILTIIFAAFIIYLLFKAKILYFEEKK